MNAPAIPAQAAAAATRTPGSKFIAGGTNLLDLMKLQIETPLHLIDVNGLGARPHRGDAGRRAAHRRAGAQHGSGGRRTHPARLRRARPGLAGRRVWPAAQQGDDRRQPAAAYALPLFLRHRPALQQTPARQRLLGHRRLQPATRHHGRQRRLHRDASQRHGRRHARARRGRGDGEAGWLDARHSDRRLSSPARRDAPHRDLPRARRTDHRRHPAAARSAESTSTARCATARPMPSRSSRWPPSSRRTARAA